MATSTKPPKIAESLPPFSPVASRLLAVASQEGASLKDFSDLIEMDPALSSDVLRLVNSPLYALRGHVSGILHAIALLGLDAVRRMALTVALRDFSRPALNTPSFKQCWRHNLACAVLAGDLADAEMMERDTGYSLGLLHDSGRLALLAVRPVVYGRLLQIGAANAEEMLAMEREMFEMDHCEVGKWLADSWSLPAEFWPVMSHHHTPCGSVGRGPVLVVQLACKLADMAGFAAWGEPKEWDVTEVQKFLPRAGPEILDPGEVIPRVAERINWVECALSL